MEHDKIQSHPKFYKKFESDLNALFEAHQYKQYIKKFKEFKKHGTPTQLLIHRYYKALMQERNYYFVIEYALKLLQNGEGNYEMNMTYMLRAMLKEQRYQEVIDFVKHLHGETIPHHLRIELNTLKDEAEKALTRPKKKRYEGKVLPKIEPEEYADMSVESKCAFIGKITNERIEAYTKMMTNALTNETEPTIITMLLLYLKAVNVNTKVTVEKFGKSLTVVPTELPDLEDMPISKHIMPKVMAEVEKESPDLVVTAETVMITVMLSAYPFYIGFNEKQLTDGFLAYIYDMVNIEHTYEPDPHAIEWITFHS